VRRVGWGVGDQALSSLTNFALGILVARSVSTEALGAFALAFATYVVLLNVARSVASQPLVVRFSGDAGDGWRRAVAASTALGVAIGLAGGLGCAAVAMAGSGALREAFAALAITMVGLLLQDAWRYAFFAVGRGRSAFANDGVWAAVMLPAVVVMALQGAGIFWLVLAWGGAATVAGVFGLAQSGIRPRPASIAAWWHEQRDLAVRFTAESMTSVLSTQAVLYALGAVIGLASVGALRAGQLLLGSVNILLQGVQLVAVPEAVVAAAAGPVRLLRVVRVVAVALGGAVAAFGIVVLLLPDDIGLAVLGKNWAAAQPVLLPVMLTNVIAALSVAPLVGLRALAAADRSLRATVIGAGLTLVLGVGGAVAGGAVGAAWGLGAAALLGLAVWVRELRAGMASHRYPLQPRTAD